MARLSADGLTMIFVSSRPGGQGEDAVRLLAGSVQKSRRGIEPGKSRFDGLLAAGELGIQYLTLYAFSVENWNRPKDEVDTLMKYLARFLKDEIGELNKNNVRLDAIGQIQIELVPWRERGPGKEVLAEIRNRTANLPGIYVDRIFEGHNFEKRIERRTIRET